MIEGIVTIVGLIITFAPALVYFNYLLTHVSKKTTFDYHLELVKDKKGNAGVVLAYISKIILGISVSSLGILMSEFFRNDLILKIFIVSLVLYLVIKYFDDKNEK